MFKRVFSMSCAGAFVVGLVSCSSGTVDQCNQLINVANRAVTDVEAVTSSPESPESRNTESFSNITETAQQAASQLEAIDLTDEQLQSYRQRFIKLYRETGAATEQLVTAVEEQNLPAAEDAYEKLEAATGQEEPLVNEVNQYCQSV
ncbi:MAG: hypothetical protein WBA10_19750 [Elainellaceae cyanobacterium]